MFAALKQHFQQEMANHPEIFGSSAAEKDTSYADSNYLLRTTSAHGVVPEHGIYLSVPRRV